MYYLRWEVYLISHMAAVFLHVDRAEAFFYKDACILNSGVALHECSPAEARRGR